MRSSAARVDGAIITLQAAINVAPDGPRRTALLGRLDRICSLGIAPEAPAPDDEWADVIAACRQTRPSWEMTAPQTPDALETLPFDARAAAAGTSSDLALLEEILAENAYGGAG